MKIHCPRCRTEAEWQGNAARPFCSEKCRLIDLGRWASEEYSIDGGRAPQHERDVELDF